MDSLLASRDLLSNPIGTRGETLIPGKKKAEAPRLAFKALAILILIMATMTPLSTSCMVNTSRNSGGIAVTPGKQPETAVTRTPQSPAGEVWRYATGGHLYSSPIVADLFGDGELEVIVGSSDNETYCLSGTKGSKLWSYATGGPTYSSPVAADLFGDGKKEVIVASDDYSVYCLNSSTGGRLWSFTAGYYVSAPVVADLFADGKPEVVVGSQDHSVYCLNGTTGSELWNYTTADVIQNSPVAVDIIGSGILEVILASNDGNVYCLNGTTGNALWSSLTKKYIYNSPFVVDLLGNGRKEVIVQSIFGVYCLNGTTGTELWNCGAAVNSQGSIPAATNLVGDQKLEVVVNAISTLVGNIIYCLNGTTGGEVWNCTIGPQLFSSLRPMIAVTDLFGNGELEVVIGSTNSTVYCLNGTSGNQVWSYRTYGHVTHSPVVTDLFGDGNKEVIALSENGNIYVLDGLTGSAVWNYTKLGYVATTPVLADVDGDSRQEIIVASFDNGVYCLSPDIAPPATVTDLTAGNADDTSIVLTWTAPGDDDMIGNVSAYIVKYSTAGPVNGSNWASATTYDQSWIPAKNGTGETRIISGLTPTTTYWFAVRACDEASNYGDISNSPSATTTGVGTIIMFCGIAAASVIIDIVVIMLVKSSKPRRDYSNT